MRDGQRQDSLLDQLADVATLAEQHGCYDAADWIRRQMWFRRRSFLALGSGAEAESNAS